MSGQDTYSPGNCTWYVADQLSWVQGGWGDAWHWAPAALAAGLQETSRPTVDSVVVYGAGDGYSVFGHVAIVIRVYSYTEFRVSEMNFAGFNQVDERDSNLGDVVAFILPPGGQPGQGAGVTGPSDSSQPGAASVAWGGIQDWLNNGADAEIQRLRHAKAVLDAIT